MSIIGYTNAGKTTLFNLLTESRFLVEDKLFATLDPATRRLRFLRGREWVITDTVGLIKNLPKDLLGSFRATFDELQESNLLIHLVDISNPFFEEHIEAVDRILMELDLDPIPRLLVFNKEDRVRREEAGALARQYGAITLSALQPESLAPLFDAIEKKLWEERVPTVTLSGDHGTVEDRAGNPGNPFQTRAREDDGSPI